MSVERDSITRFVKALEQIAPPQADERFSFAGTSRQMKKSMTLCSLRLCGKIFNLMKNCGAILS